MNLPVKPSTNLLYNKKNICSQLQEITEVSNASYMYVITTTIGCYEYSDIKSVFQNVETTPFIPLMQNQTVEVQFWAGNPRNNLMVNAFFMMNSFVTLSF